MMASILIAWSAAAALQPGPASAPLSEPAFRVNAAPGFANYLGAPTRTDEGSLRAWSWSVRSNRLTPDAVDAFLNDHECRGGRFRRVRQERFSGGRLVSVDARQGVWRAPTGWEMEERQLGEICRGSVLNLPMVPSIDAARRQIRVAR